MQWDLWSQEEAEMADRRVQVSEDNTDRHTIQTYRWTKTSKIKWRCSLSL